MMRTSSTRDRSSGLHVTMHLEEALDAAEIVVLAVHPASSSMSWKHPPVPSASHVLLVSPRAWRQEALTGAIESMLDERGSESACRSDRTDNRTEAADGVMTTALVASHDASVASRLARSRAPRPSSSTPRMTPSRTSWPSHGLVDRLAKIGSLGGDNLKARGPPRGSGKDVSSCPCSDRILRPPSDLLDWVICTSPPPAPLAGTGGWARSSGQASTSIRP